MICLNIVTFLPCEIVQVLTGILPCSDCPLSLISFFMLKALVSDCDQSLIFGLDVRTGTGSA